MLILTLVASLAASTAVSRPAKKDVRFFDLKAEGIDGSAQDLAAYKGKVVLVVNTASECGFTPQYGGLEKLWKDYKAKNFVVLGFPSNDFGGQEPGTEAEIKKFCSAKFGVTFPMFAKVKTKGEGQSDVYKFVATKHGEPKWNFHKYLIGKDGKVLEAFPSRVTPESIELRGAIDAALK